MADDIAADLERIAEQDATAWGLCDAPQEDLRRGAAEIKRLRAENEALRLRCATAEAPAHAIAEEAAVAAMGAGPLRFSPKLQAFAEQRWFREAVERAANAAALLEIAGVGSGGGVTIALYGRWHLMRTSDPLPRAKAGEGCDG